VKTDKANGIVDYADDCAIESMGNPSILWSCSSA
jgi:hypothetical protein